MSFVYGYHSGVFEDLTDLHELDHDLEVVGWGEDDKGQKYWHVRNSWGSYWGENGFFRVARGNNQLRLESGGCVFPIMDLSDEKRLAEGAVVGSMYGLVDASDASQYSQAYADYDQKWLMEPRQEFIHGMNPEARRPEGEPVRQPNVAAAHAPDPDPDLQPQAEVMAAAAVEGPGDGGSAVLSSSFPFGLWLVGGGAALAALAVVKSGACKSGGHSRDEYEQVRDL